MSKRPEFDYELRQLFAIVFDSNEEAFSYNNEIQDRVDEIVARPSVTECRSILPKDTAEAWLRIREIYLTFKAEGLELPSIIEFLPL